MALWNISLLTSALIHSTCTRKPTESHQIPPSLCVILKAIRAGVGWVWLARLISGVFLTLTLELAATDEELKLATDSMGFNSNPTILSDDGA